MAHDVTDRKAYEDQILFLMREINHRAKNMLSLVQAVARQTAQGSPKTLLGALMSASGRSQPIKTC
jgi:two-component sensor histidine kinase